jgi:hypothetical protein
MTLGARRRAAVVMACALRLISLALIGGCAINGGPVIGFRGRHPTVGWDVGSSLLYLHGNLGESFPLGASPEAHAFLYGGGGIAVPIPYTSPLPGLGSNFGGDAAIGYSGGDGVHGLFVSAAAIGGVPLNQEPADRYVAFVALGIRWFAGAPEVFLSPQLAVAWSTNKFPD